MPKQSASSTQRSSARDRKKVSRFQVENFTPKSANFKKTVAHSVHNSTMSSTTWSSTMDPKWKPRISISKMPPSSSSAAALPPTFYNNQDTTMIETHVLLTIACVKYKDALTDKKKEPRLWYTTMQKAMIDMLCVEVRKEIEEEERLKNE